MNLILANMIIYAMKQFNRIHGRDLIKSTEFQQQLNPARIGLVLVIITALLITDIQGLQRIDLILIN